MNNTLVVSDVLAERSLELIASKLRSALHFLGEYESLMPDGRPLLDATYDSIRDKKLCVELVLRDVDVLVSSFVSIFSDRPCRSRFEAVELWSFEFNYRCGLFHSVPAFKANIQTLIDRISTGEVIEPPVKMGQI